ncbi:putative reverse transcriptase domain-containing protein [Tanacetum coccineum]
MKPWDGGGLKDKSKELSSSPCKSTAKRGRGYTLTSQLLDTCKYRCFQVPIVPADPIVAPEVGTISVVSPTGVLDLVNYSSSSDFDPSEDYLPPVPDLHWFHPSYVLMTRRRTPYSADLLPPRKRFEIHTHTSIAEREHTECGVRELTSDVREDDEEFEAEASVADRKEIDVDPLAIGDSFESSRGGIHDLEDIVYDIVYYMSEVRIDRIIEIETTQTQLEYLKVQAMLSIKRDRVDRLRWHMALSQEEFHQVRRDRDDTRRRLRRLESYVERHLEALATYEEARAANALEAENQSQNGNDGNNGNGGNGNGGNGNPYESGRGDRPVAREGTYQDFIKCQPLNFKGTEGVVGLIMWFKKTETVFHINNCPEKYQVKYATCTLLNSALTWWNSHKRTIGTEAAFTMSWRELMKLMAEVYCPINEIQKMEFELWNLTVKNNDLAAIKQEIQELDMMCTRWSSEEEDRVEKSLRGSSIKYKGM